MKTTFTTKVIRLKAQKPTKIGKIYQEGISKKWEQNIAENQKLLQRCHNLWNNLAPTRDARTRARKYYTGDQWHELVLSPDGKSFIREDDFIKMQGRIPFKQNMIFQIVNNITGQYRKNPTKTLVVSRAREKQIVGEMLTNAINSVAKINSVEEIDAKNLLDFILSGIAITKTSFTYFPSYNKHDVLFKNINLNNIFFNANIDDPRVEMQLSIIGEIIDTDLQSIIGAFAKNKNDEQAIRQIYGIRHDQAQFLETSRLDADAFDNSDFLNPSDPALCRYYEIWSRESAWRIHYHDYASGKFGVTAMPEKELEAINQQRLQQAIDNGIPPEEVAIIKYKNKFEHFWVCRCITPYGHTLFQAETPYKHEEHPYNIVMKAIDGIPISIVGAIIDQQRFINRLLNLMDLQLGNSSKNLLVVPKETIPNGMDIHDIASEWSSPNGAIALDINQTNAVAKPYVLSSQSHDAGANSLLSIQMQLINQISGVNSAMQGQAANPGTPASLYAQEAQNSSVNITDALEIFNSLREKRDTKALKLIRQYYNQPRFVSVIGNIKGAPAEVYDPEQVYNVDTQLVITQGVDTPAFRQLSDNLMMQLLQMQLIDIETYLENSSMPNADNILESIKKIKQQQQQQQDMMQQQQAVMQQQPANNNPQN